MAKTTLPAMTREQASSLVEYLGETLLNLLTADDPEKPWSRNSANLPDQGRSSGDESNPSAASRGPADGDSAALSVIGLKALAAGRIRKDSEGNFDLRPDLRKAVYQLTYLRPVTMTDLVGRK